MKQTVEKRKPNGPGDYIALALTTFGVGYGPIAPGTWGSLVGVAIYVGFQWLVTIFMAASPDANRTALFITAITVTSLTIFSLMGIWASGRAIPLLGNSDPPQAVVDEVIGQLVTFLFIPFTFSWALILPGFILFRLFDIWKPYPIDDLQILPGGLGICGDDIVAGVYAGICLAVGYAVYLLI